MPQTSRKNTDSQSDFDFLQPPVLINHFPYGESFGRIPSNALPALNINLKPREFRLLLYYACQKTGFCPSAKEIEYFTGIDKTNLYKVRSKLETLGYITIYTDPHTGEKRLTINWNRIEEHGKMLRASAELALMDPNNKGHMYPRSKKAVLLPANKSAAYESSKTEPTIGEICELDAMHAMASPKEQPPVFDGYYENEVYRLEKLTESEFAEALPVDLFDDDELIS